MRHLYAYLSFIVFLVLAICADSKCVRPEVEHKKTREAAISKVAFHIFQNRNRVSTLGILYLTLPSFTFAVVHSFPVQRPRSTARLWIRMEDTIVLYQIGPHS